MIALALALAAQAPAGDAAPFRLTLDELVAWHLAGPTADDRNVSREPLAPRFVDRDAEPDGGAHKDPRARVLYAPDGMNDLADSLGPRPAFNRYGFNAWAQIDILNWFAGDARRPVAIPARPWVDTAHRNGVKVLGTLFLAPVTYGGDRDTTARLVRRDADGTFPAARALVAIARHYGFDGWLVNAETDLWEVGTGDDIRRDPARRRAAARLAGEIRAFVADLRRLSPEPMEIHWYDSLLPDGRVVWQNALNRRNLPFLHAADAMFLNYWWTAPGLNAGARLAERVGRSRYDLFVGADLWPARRGAQAAFRNTDWLRSLRRGDGRLVGSLALFATHFNYGFEGDARTPAFSRFKADPSDVARYEAAERRLFAGDDGDMARVDTTGWDGVGSAIPARSTIATLPFSTRFNTGRGRRLFARGRANGGAWSDIGAQSLLPSWQFATSGARAGISYDYDRAWSGGSALRIAPLGAGVGEVPLYLTRLGAPGGVSIRTVTHGADRGYWLRLTTSDGDHTDFAIRPGAWRSDTRCLRLPPGAHIRRISVVFDGATPPAPLWLGEIALGAGCPE